MGFPFPLSCFPSEVSVPTTQEVSNKINLEAIVVSIDQFFNKNPFFVAGVTFTWLVVVPLGQEYFRKYKFISAIDAFRKLRDDPNYQLLDIRDKKSLDVLNSPNLKILSKSVLQVNFSEGDEEGFLKQVLENSKDPEKTSFCIIDEYSIIHKNLQYWGVSKSAVADNIYKFALQRLTNTFLTLFCLEGSFDGNSMKVAELLAKNGFKEAYAVRGGIRGNKGWQFPVGDTGTLLPPSVHIYPKKKVKALQQPSSNGGVNGQDKGSGFSSSITGPLATRPEKIGNGSVNSSSELTSGTKYGPRSSSPYPNYPDLEPPSSPTPSKPER